jgi:hypothetical protein
MILDAVAKLGGKQVSMVSEDEQPYGAALSDELHPVRWTYASYDQVPRQLTCPRIVYGQCSTRDRE